MPSILQNNLFSEPVRLEPSDESAYRPPHAKEDGSTANSLHAKKIGGGKSFGSEKTSAATDTHDNHAGEMNGTCTSPKRPVSPERRKNSILKRDESPSVNGVRREGSSLPSAHANEQRGDAPITNGNHRSDTLDFAAVAEKTVAWRPSSRRSLESEDTITTKERGHGRTHSASAPQQFNPPLSHSNPIASSSASLAYAHGQPTTAGKKPPQAIISPPTFNDVPANTSTPSLHPTAPALHHRHTLGVPRVSMSRTSRDFSLNTVSDGASESGRMTPTIRTPRASYSIARQPTRSMYSDVNLDEMPPDSDIARWTENIRQKRASRKRRKEEEEDDRVVVGTKVDINHVNWVTAYNMLTGIRFTVSRTNAKMDRELTDADFDAKHKFSFDITGNELTPSAKYDFKFKDYAPWVFRRLRSMFKLDPADYLVSLTSKYILSELGSPGKSGSFFYFSRDYKYIIKTIHHSEHKLLRKILREYFAHIENNPNTLMSQFYGLHRVKIPYGRKIHFVVMNNLFPPHRDIHQTFDLKGSTVGRDYKEQDLEENPRATLKDLNWLRRNYHFEFGPAKKSLFIEQLKRDVALLEKLHIMDYSLLVGIHDLSKGNNEKLRDKTLQVFQPGGDDEGESQFRMLTRTPSKLENARQAKHLREIIKRERPVPIDQTITKMPEELLEGRKNFIFYSDDGGYRATHSDNTPGEKIYYLGIIDCLTHYGFVKRAEHCWKGLSNNKTQISPVDPDSYGERFEKFIGGLTMTEEEVKHETDLPSQKDGSVSSSRRPHGQYTTRKSAENVIEKAEKQAEKTEEKGAEERPDQDRTLGAVRSPSADRSAGVTGTTLPVVEEAGEGGSREDSLLERSRSRPPSNVGQLPSPPPMESLEGKAKLPSIPSFNRLSMGLGPLSASPPPIE